MRRVLRSAAFLLVLAGIAAPADAQYPYRRKREPRREGFFAGLTAGAGSAGVSCDDACGSGRETGLALGLRAGSTAGSPNILVGASFDLWTKKAGGIRDLILNSSVAAWYYPLARAPLFLKGGLGVNIYKASGQGLDIKGTGFGATAGAGYDFRLGRNFALTPEVNFYLGWPGDLKDRNAGGALVSSGWKQNVADVRVGVTYYTHR